MTATLVPEMTNINFPPKLSQWVDAFETRIYQISGKMHPGMAIENEAVRHVQDLLKKIVKDLLDQRPSNVSDLHRFMLRTSKDYWVFAEAMDAVTHGTFSSRRVQFGLRHQQDPQQKMTTILKENCHERRDKRELERMAAYIVAMCEFITEDILKLTGNYVKNIPSNEQKISLQNLKIVMMADRSLNVLTSSLNTEEEDDLSNGFLSNIFDFNYDDLNQEKKDDTYASVAQCFFKEETRFLQELKQIGAFRRKLEETLTEEDKQKYIGLIFGNLDDIHEVVTKLVRGLDDSIEMNDPPYVGREIWELAEAKEFDVFAIYCMREMEERDELLTPVIRDAIDDLLNDNQYTSLFESDEQCTSSLCGQTLKMCMRYLLPTLLHSPIVHLASYLEYIIKLSHLSDNREDQNDLKHSESYMKLIVEKIYNLMPNIRTLALSEQQFRSDQRCYLTKLPDIERNIEGFVGPSLLKNCTQFVKEADLQLVQPRNRVTDRHVYLFDQVLILTKRHKYYKFKDRIAVQSISIMDLPDSDFLKNAFVLQVKERGEILKTLTLTCRNQTEKEEFMSALLKVCTRSLFARILQGYVMEEEKRIPLVLPGPEQYRFAEPDSEENITLEEYYSTSGIPLIKCATVLKLVERLTYHTYSDNKFMQTFFISYRSFCTPNELLDMLIERFNVPVPRLPQQEMRGGPLAGRYDTVQSHGLSGGPQLSVEQMMRFRKEYERPIQRRVICVIDHWVKNHWYDFEDENNANLLKSLKGFLLKPAETVTSQHRKNINKVLLRIERKSSPLSGGGGQGQTQTAFNWENLENHSESKSFEPKKPEIVWHTAKKGDIASYDLLTLHPLEIGRQLTLLHFDLYRAILPIELVDSAWTKTDKKKKSPQLLKLTDHSTRLTYWVSRSIVTTESLDERIVMFNRVLEVMSVFEKLNDFTGLVALYSALNSTSLYRLTWWERIDQDKKKCYDRFQKLCSNRYIEMNKRIEELDPPIVPFFGHYLTNIFFFDAGNNTYYGGPGKGRSCEPQSPPMHNKDKVFFGKCRKICEQISKIQLYQKQPYALELEPSIRRFFESINPKDGFDSDDELEKYLYEQSTRIQPSRDHRDPVPDVKPKHSPQTLKSPGIKPPKSTTNNHYSSAHHTSPFVTHNNTVPSTPNPIHDHDGFRQPYGSQLSQEDPPHFSIVDVLPGKQPKIITESKRGHAPPHLQPPPLPTKVKRPTIPTSHPKSPSAISSSIPPSRHTAATISSTPSRQAPPPLNGIVGAGPPPLYPKKFKSNSGSPARKSPPTPASASATSRSPSHFEFPQIEAPISPHRAAAATSAAAPPMSSQRQSTPPAIPPRRPADTLPQALSDDMMRLVLDRPSASTDAHSPTVCLSVPLPPALPPRRLNSNPAPPPLPPKSHQRHSSGPSGSGGSTLPPALPPKTYKNRV